MRLTKRAWGLGVAATLVLWSSPADAIPYFARKYEVTCSTCHLLPPALNEVGQRFAVNGYRFDEGRPTTATVPVAAWLTHRTEYNPQRDAVQGFPSRLELISSDALTPWLSYFVEWRSVSLQTSSGPLVDRAGRFEDLFFGVRLPRRVSLTIGQYRMLNQWDVSRRLTLSEPLAFAASVPGAPSRRRRVQALRAFSLAGRAPAIRATLQTFGRRGSDGWFHEVTLPFTGEFAAPLGRNARQNASFEFEARPKGALYETYVRRSLSSVGAAIFVGDHRWLANLTGVVQAGNHQLVASAGTARFPGGHNDFRASVGHFWVPREWLGLGARLDHQSARRADPGLASHINLNFPARRYTFLVTVEQRWQRRNHGTAVELSGVF